MATPTFVAPIPFGTHAIASAPLCSRRIRTTAFPRDARVRMALDAAPANAATIAERKAAVRAAIADAELGLAVLDDPEAQARIDAVIRELEAVNPTENPADHDLRRARWRLLYTNSPIVLGRNRPGFSRPEKCWQTLDMQSGADEGAVRNEEEGSVNILGLNLTWRNQIVGKCRALRGERIRLKFEKFTIGNWFQVPFPANVVGWQDQLFLDEELRVARTHFGNVFVLEREPGWE